MQLDFSTLTPYLPELARGVWLTIKLSLLSTVLGFLLGTLCALGSTHSNRLLRRLASIYVELIRNTPLLVQLFLVYFGLAALGLKIDALHAAALSLAINVGAYTSEIVRAGIEATPPGQIEAADSLGLPGWLVTLQIVLPPAVEKVYAALSSQYVLLMLATSVTSQISVEELTAVTNRVQSETFRSFEMYLLAAGIYLLLSFAMRGLLILVGQWVFARRRHLGTPLQ